MCLLLVSWCTSFIQRVQWFSLEFLWVAQIYSWRSNICSLRSIVSPPFFKSLCDRVIVYPIRDAHHWRHFLPHQAFSELLLAFLEQESDGRSPLRLPVDHYQADAYRKPITIDPPDVNQSQLAAAGPTTTKIPEAGDHHTNTPPKHTAILAHPNLQQQHQHARYDSWPKVVFPP